MGNKRNPSVVVAVRTILRFVWPRIEGALNSNIVHGATSMYVQVDITLRSIMQVISGIHI